MKIIINIYETKIAVEGPDRVVEKIKKDMHFFCETEETVPAVYIYLDLAEPDYYIIPKDLKAVMYHPEFTMYEKNNSKYIDYHGEALSVYISGSGRIDITSSSEGLLHELGYLAMLSFAGEMLEEKKIFRIHALGFECHKKGVIIMVPSGGGKTTLFWELLKSCEINVFSDDVVLIDKKMRMLPFPLRIGIREKQKHLFKDIPDSFIYEIYRRKYGKKILLDADWYKQKIALFSNAAVLISGKRWNSLNCTIRRCSKCHMYVELFKNFVIGIGLPQLIEYLNLSISLKSFFRLIINTVNRKIFAFRLVLSCKCFTANLGRNSEYNAKKILELIEEKE
ncbi:hypothetical protein ACFLUV_04325 [Elusimicrobiota bacterium]